MESFDNGHEVTKFETICSILSELWINYKEDKDFSEFIQYNDLGLPLAFMLDSEIVEPKDLAFQYVLETWQIFLSALNIDKDMGWNSLDDLFKYVEDKNKE
jgi:hypothetical protein